MPDRSSRPAHPSVALQQGRQAARALGERLKSVPIDRIISSPLERAHETARLIIGERSLDIESDERLIEFDYGAWEGMTTDEVAHKMPDEFELYDVILRSTGPAAERTATRPRSVPAPLSTIVLERWSGNGDRTVLLVGHSSINRVLLAAVTSVPMADYRRRFLQTGRI